MCEPDAALLRKLYVPLIGYINQIETFIKSKPGQQCSLHAFLSTHVRDTFLAKGHNRTLELTIESLSKNQDAWRTIITPEEMKAMGLSRPLLQSTVLFESRKFCTGVYLLGNFCTLLFIYYPLQELLKQSN